MLASHIVGRLTTTRNASDEKANNRGAANFQRKLGFFQSSYKTFDPNGLLGRELLAKAKIGKAAGKSSPPKCRVVVVEVWDCRCATCV
jgi:hypothetical protein